MQKVTTYFEISKEADMAYDLETNEPSACYAEVSTDHDKQLTDEEIQEVHDAHRSILSGQVDIQEDWIRVITKEEYDANMDDEP